MYRAIPSASKILTNKWQSNEHSIHMENLRKIKGTVDMKEPPKFKHLKKKMKKTQMLEERYTEIERENRILLEKMTNILQKQRGTLFSANSAGVVGSGGQTQPIPVQPKEQITLQPLSAVGQRRSLNREARKRELVKITKENQQILKRLQEKSASYNVSRWQKEEDSRKKILRNICEFPLIEAEAGLYMQSQPDFIIKKKKTSSSTGQAFYKKTKGYTSGGNSQMRPNQQYVNQIVKKQSLYTGEHDLGNGMYLVEMLISQTDDLVISAQHVELPDSFIIEIEAQKVQHLINEFENQFSTMASFLKIMNKRMVLLNPKFLNKQNPDENGEQKADESKKQEDEAEGQQEVQEELAATGENVNHEQDQQEAVEQADVVGESPLGNIDNEQTNQENAEGGVTLSEQQNQPGGSVEGGETDSQVIQQTPLVLEVGSKALAIQEEDDAVVERSDQASPNQNIQQLEEGVDLRGTQDAVILQNIQSDANQEVKQDKVVKTSRTSEEIEIVETGKVQGPKGIMIEQENKVEDAEMVKQEE